MTNKRSICTSSTMLTYIHQTRNSLTRWRNKKEDKLCSMIYTFQLWSNCLCVCLLLRSLAALLIQVIKSILKKQRRSRLIHHHRHRRVQMSKDLKEWKTKTTKITKKIRKNKEERKRDNIQFYLKLLFKLLLFFSFSFLFCFSLCGRL